MTQSQTPLAHHTDRLSGRSIYILAIMGSAYFLSIADRSIIGILLPQVREEFQLSDTEIGLLVGMAYGLIYSVLSIPMGALGDRFSRRNVLLGAVVFFSAATVLSGTVVQFWQLLLARVGIGAGLAGVQPSINSILADVVPKKKRATAMAIGTACGRMGGVAAVLVGGYVAAEYGWRTAFVVAGIPGFFLALILFLTVKEPARGAIDNRIDKGKAPPLWTTLRFLFACPSYRNILIGSVFILLTTTTLNSFTPMMLMRGHDHITLKDTAVIVTGFGILSVLATWLVGVAADKLARRDMRWMLYAPALLQIIILPFFPMFLLSGDLTMAIIGGAIVNMFGGAALAGPLFAVIQNVAPLRVRSMAMGTYSFIAGIVGAALGPQLIGIVGDFLVPAVGKQLSFSWAFLVLAIPTLIIGAFFFWRSAQTLDADIARAEASD